MDLELFKAIIDNANDIVVVTEAAPLEEPGPRIIYVNPAFEALTGYRSEEVIGRSPRFLQGPETSPESRREISRALREQRPVHTTVLNYAKDGQPYWLDIKIVPLAGPDRKVRYFAGIERDLTERKELEERLRVLATTDPLSGLYNRRQFFELAETELDRAHRYRHACSVLMLDIDHFKEVNDRFGHQAGDAVIQALARMMRETLRTVDVIGRIGGEEFAAVLPETASDVAMLTAERLCQALSDKRDWLSAHAAHVSVSIGVAAVHPEDTGIDQVLARADAALYAAKKAGRDRVMLEYQPR
jgi:diguanylate cyclase (GGDEF)-like protein/PAS domain S-box-containing protein